jgi:stage II sporulation protein D
MRRFAPAAAVILTLLAAAPAADAASRLVIKGRGFGHGIGMSQYGALGYAQHGFGYADILRRYYTDTAVSQLGQAPDVRVLLQSGKRSLITGAVAAGEKKLDPARVYAASAAPAGAGITLRSPTGRKLGTYPAPLRFAAPSGGSLQLRANAANGLANGRYRGALEISPSSRGVMAVNTVGLEDYVRGVISAESPAGWPAEALKAQAVAARTYAVTTNAGSANDGFDQYADTRSQMYKGIAAEFPATDAAVQATAGEVVTQAGTPVTTYFFSTSGGHTENVEFSFVGALPRPWLKGVDDPFDSTSPKHTWGPITLSASRVKTRLRGLIRGSFRGIRVLQRGASPRIVRAQVIGTTGVTSVTGPELRRRFGLNDTWATFTYVSSKPEKTPSPVAPEPAPASPPAPPPVAAAPGTGSGGSSSSPRPEDQTAEGSGGAAASSVRHRRPVLAGVIDRARRGQTIRVQQRIDGGWRTVGVTVAKATGRYRATLAGAGTFRVVWGDVAGPTVRVR